MGAIGQLPPALDQQISTTIKDLSTKTQNQRLTESEKAVLHQFRTINWASDTDSMTKLENSIKDLQGFVEKSPLKSEEAMELQSQVSAMKNACNVLKQNKSPGLSKKLIERMQKDLDGVNQAILSTGGARVAHREMMQKENQRSLAAHDALAAHKEMVKTANEAQKKAQGTAGAVKLSETQTQVSEPLKKAQGKGGAAKLNETQSPAPGVSTGRAQVDRSKEKPPRSYVDAARTPLSYARVAQKSMQTAKSHEAELARAAAARAQALAQAKTQTVAQPTPEAKKTVDAGGWQTVKSKKTKPHSATEQTKTPPAEAPPVAKTPKSKDNDGWQIAGKRK